MRTDLPVIGQLTPDAAPEAPAHFEIFDSPVRGGLPHILPLFAGWRVLLSVPTGAANAWLDAAPDEPLTDGAPRLRFQREGTTVCVVPLVLGPPFRISAPGRHTPLAAMVLGWRLHAGDMRGPGNHGSFLRLAAAIADRASPSFGPVPPSDFVIAALPREERTESRPGKRIPLRYQRLAQLRLRRSLDFIR